MKHQDNITGDSLLNLPSTHLNMLLLLEHFQRFNTNQFK